MKILPSFLTRAGSLVVICALGLSALLFIALSEIDSRHLSSLESVNENAVSKIEWIWISSLTGVQYQNLSSALSDYVMGSDAVTHADVLEKFDVFWGWFNSLEVFQSDSYTLMLDAQELTAEEKILIIESSQLAEDLKRSSLSFLEGVEIEIMKAERGDKDFLQAFTQRSQIMLSDVSELQKTVLLLVRGSLIQNSQYSARLLDQLRWAHFSLSLIAFLAISVVGYYIVLKSRDNRALETLNSRLQGLFEEQSRYAEELDDLAHSDPLSGLLNRAGYHRRMDSIFADGGQHGILFIDLDLFKMVNDSSGHAAGDDLIRQLGEKLKQICELWSADVNSGTACAENLSAARYGGDEFVVLYSCCTREHFESLAAAVHRVVSPFVFAQSGHKLEITASIGAHHFASENQSDTAVMACVDAACYEAKRLGGGRLKYYDNKQSVPESRASDAQTIELIQQALAFDRFQIYFQPIVALHESASQCESFELLLRMYDGANNIVSPGEFLDVAERYGFMQRIDKWVVVQALSWLEANNLRAHGYDHININLSALSISDDEFVANLVKMFDEYVVDVSEIYFEITESASLRGEAPQNLKLLKSLGLGLSLDDFGSGFSSFGYLESMPVDQIKIDGAFIRDIDSNKTHQEFVSAIVTIARSMGKSVVAEFVENRQSLEILRRLGVDACQGYFIDKPAPLPSNLSLLQKKEIPGVQEESIAA